MVKLRFIAGVPIYTSYILGIYTISVLLNSLVAWYERILLFILLKSFEHFPELILSFRTTRTVALAFNCENFIFVGLVQIIE